jgi:hypothetical protein
MPLRRKPKRAPGENPVFRTHFIRGLVAHDRVARLADILEPLRAELDPGYHKIPLELADLLHDTGQRGRDRYALALTELGRDYFRAWLRLHGIDPDTGKMTRDGLTLFQDLTQPDDDRLAA